MTLMLLNESFVALTGFNRQCGHGRSEGSPVKFHMSKLQLTMCV